MSLTGERPFSDLYLTNLLNAPPELKRRLVSTLWPHINSNEYSYIEDDFADFFVFVGKSLQDLQKHERELADTGLNGLLATVAEIKAHQTSTKDELVNRVRIRCRTSPRIAIARSIELTVRLWLGVNVSSKGLVLGSSNSRNSRIQWPNDMSLQEVVAEQFRRKCITAVDNELYFDKSFTVANLKRICRVRIRWTDNLVDHLKLEGPRGNRSLAVYRQKSCLIHHRDDPDLIAIGKDVVEEAIRTLDLLFPFGEPKTIKFLKKQGIHLNSIPPSQLSPPTNLTDFRYWRADLALLLKIFNGPPESFTQTLLDTRNYSNFASLWCGLVGIFVITMVFGVSATVYSVKQYYLAIKSYDLALALACLQTPAPSDFCQPS